MSRRPRFSLASHRSRLALGITLVLTTTTLGCGKKQEQPPAPRPAKAQQQQATRQSIPETLQSLVAKPDADRRARLVERIAGLEPGDRTDLGAPGVSAVGITADHWTVGRPAAVLVRNDADQPMTPTLVLGCYAPGGQAPKVTIDDGEGKVEFVFDPNGERDQVLAPVAAKSSRLYIITTDTTWQAGAPDNRKLGVQILPKARLDGGSGAAPAPAAQS